MRRRVAGTVLVSSWVLLGVAGCAKQEVVKKDEGIAPAVSVAKPALKTEQPVKKEAVAVDSMKNKASQTPPPASMSDDLRKIYFNFDSYQLSDEARSALVKDAEAIKRENLAKVRIEGNCDERGSDEYNLALGEKRAKSALEYLVTMGIPAERLTVISYGKEKPADPGHTEAAWAKNRRDDLVVVSK